MKSCRYCTAFLYKENECLLYKKKIKDVYTAQKCKKYIEVSPITKEIRKDIYRRNRNRSPYRRFRRFG